MKRRAKTSNLTPVDDVRRVREELDRECGGDKRVLAARANKTAQKHLPEIDWKPSRVNWPDIIQSASTTNGGSFSAGAMGHTRFK
jgi:hypothetical protein